MVEATASACATALTHGWIASKGVPDVITTDRGPSFTSELWKALAALLGIQMNKTTSYNPEANGLVEQSHRSLKQALIARPSGPDWFSQLPWVLLGLRTTPKEGLRVSAAEMTFGEALVVPGEFFPDTSAELNKDNLEHLRRMAGQFAPCRPTKTNTRQSYIPPSLHKTQYVFVRRDGYKPPLTPPYKGPFLVLCRSNKAFKIDMQGRFDWVAIDRLKPAYMQPTELNIPHQTTRSGRVTYPPVLLMILTWTRSDD